MSSMFTSMSTCCSMSDCAAATASSSNPKKRKFVRELEEKDEDYYMAVERAEPKPRLDKESKNADGDYVYITKSRAETVLFGGPSFICQLSQRFTSYAALLEEAIDSAQLVQERGNRACVSREAFETVLKLSCAIGACETRIDHKLRTMRSYKKSPDYLKETQVRADLTRQFNVAFNEMKRTTSYD